MCYQICTIILHSMDRFVVFAVLATLCFITVESSSKDAPAAAPSSLLEPLSKPRNGDNIADFWRNLMRDDGQRQVEPVDEACQPIPDPKHAQYLVGYGSLMQQESKDRTAPNTGTSIPVLIRGFRREWNTVGTSVGLSTTYLGVVKADGSGNDRNLSSFNSVVFKLPVTGQNLHATLKSYDDREEFYCRQKVPSENVVPLLKNKASEIESNADFWIYVNKPQFTAPPSAKYPIVQSYVDIFISGCLELEEIYRLPNFTDFCISSTNGWSPEWVNDRIYPRRAFIFQPRATAIDKVLAKNLPSVFDKIVVEGK